VYRDTGEHGARDRSQREHDAELFTHQSSTICSSAPVLPPLSIAYSSSFASCATLLRSERAATSDSLGITSSVTRSNLTPSGTSHGLDCAPTLPAERVRSRITAGPGALRACS
jgi:hypothetical protein